jgi:hypothetical protein
VSPLPRGAVRIALERLAAMTAIGVAIALVGWYCAVRFHISFTGWDF